MGSITEVWKNSGEWKKFTDFLDTSEPEGYDSSGVPMKLSRYAVFLQIYVNLYYKEKELLGKLLSEGTVWFKDGKTVNRKFKKFQAKKNL